MFSGTLWQNPKSAHQFAAGAGLAKAPAKRQIVELAEKLPGAARKLQCTPDSGFAGIAVVERIIALLEQRCALTIRRLSEPSADG